MKSTWFRFCSLPSISRSTRCGCWRPQKQQNIQKYFFGCCEDAIYNLRSFSFISRSKKIFVWFWVDGRTWRWRMSWVSKTLLTELWCFRMIQFISQLMRNLWWFHSLCATFIADASFLFCLISISLAILLAVETINLTFFPLIYESCDSWVMQCEHFSLITRQISHRISFNVVL